MASRRPAQQQKQEPRVNVDDLIVDLKSLESVTEVLAGVKQLRQFYQLERDKVHSFWDITKKEVENVKHSLLNADQEMEEMESRHQVEIKVYKQKVRHLLYEHRLQVQEIRSQSDRDITKSIESHHLRLAQLRAQKSSLFNSMRDEVRANEGTVDNVRSDHQYLVNTTKHTSYAGSLQNLEESYKVKLATLRDELDLRRRAEIHEIEERKNEHINTLIRLHQEKFAEMKHYYNQITGNNLAVIKSLKEEIANMKRNDEHNENLMYDIEKENHHLSEPLENAKRDVAELQLQLHNYEKDKLSLRHTRSRLKSLDGQYRQLLEDHEALQKKYQETHADRETLKGRFENALHEAMDTTQERNLALQQKLLEVQTRVEERDVQLMNVLKAVNLEPYAQEMITREVEDTLDAKNRAIKDLHFELKAVEKKHRDVVSEYERRCASSGIPVLDLEQIV